MNALIEEHLDAIRALCREYGVARLELFGSAATDAFDPTHSDVDFLIEYLPSINLGLWLERHFELRDQLASLIGRPVDLIMAGSLRNPYVVRSVNESKRLLYAA